MAEKEIPFFRVLEENKNIFDNEKKFEIPLYQREFAWGDKQIEQLIDDIYDYNGETYYIGSMVVYERDTCFEVIDGQQRLTALFLLLNYLKSKNSNLPDVRKNLVYSCRDKSKYTLEKIESYIEGKNLEDSLLEPNITNGLTIIKSYFEKNISNLCIDTFIEKLKKVVIFRIEVPQHTDLNRYFEIMNTRGEQLEQVDIIKAKLMGFLHQKSNDEKIFETIWNACYDMDGFVQMHFKYNSTEPRTKIFGNNWNTVPVSDWDEYYILTQETQVEKEEDDEFFEKYTSIIEFPFFLLHCLKNFIAEKKITATVSLDDKKLLKSFENVINIYKTINALAEFSKEFVLYLLKNRFLFDKYFIKRKHDSKGDDGVWTLEETKENDRKPERSNTKIDNHDEILYLQAAMRVSYTAPKSMTWITKLLSILSKENYNIQSFKFDTENLLKDEVSAFFKIKNFYSMGVQTPHIVLNYLDYLLWVQQGHKTDFDFEFRNSVEHWYPQNPSENTFTKWEDVNRFGNLCLIQRNINSKFSNKTPESKKNDHSKMINNGSLKLRLMSNETVEKNGKLAHVYWVNEACLAHENEMLNLLRKACGLPEKTINEEPVMITLKE